EERVADPTASAGDAPMYVPPNSVPVLQSLIAEAAALDRALREQLRGILASVEAERARNARLIDMLEEIREWGEAKHAGLQHEIAHLRDQLQARRENASTNEWSCEKVEDTE